MRLPQAVWLKVKIVGWMLDITELVYLSVSTSEAMFAQHATLVTLLLLECSQELRGGSKAESSDPAMVYNGCEVSCRALAHHRRT